VSSSVAFVEQGKPADSTAKPLIFIPSRLVTTPFSLCKAAGRAKKVKTSSNTPMGLRIEEGHRRQSHCQPSADLKDGAEVWSGASSK
jgi:hypothetical protein